MKKLLWSQYRDHDNKICFSFPVYDLFDLYVCVDHLAGYNINSLSPFCSHSVDKSRFSASLHDVVSEVLKMHAS